MSLFTKKRSHYVSLCADEDEDADSRGLVGDSETATPAPERNWKALFYLLLVGSAFILTGLLTEAALLLQTHCPSHCPSRTPGAKEPYAPLPRLPYINKFILKDSTSSSFLGQPRPELDEAWHDLLDPTALRFSDDEFVRAGNITSVRHKSGGYVGGMGFVHNLHCLKRIKQFLHPEYYYADVGRGDKVWEGLYMHVDHCLESLRQAAMCAPDLNIFTLAWESDRRKPDVTFPQAHACIDWTALSMWTKSRAATYVDVVGFKQ